MFKRFVLLRMQIHEENNPIQMLIILHIAFCCMYQYMHPIAQFAKLIASSQTKASGSVNF